jgi:GNAT superfamily N-acetyltransferase
VITIAPAEAAHAEALAILLEEMDRFYGATEVETLELRRRQINESLFADPPSAHCLLGWDGGTMVGFAAYSFLWPAIGLTRSLYLKELYIAETARKGGVGRLLMQRLYEIAVKNECSRVEWTTDRDNTDAQRFYAQLGVPVKASKLFYRIEGDELRRQAANGLGFTSPTRG